jgi:hypothetical protein
VIIFGYENSRGEVLNILFSSTVNQFIAPLCGFEIEYEDF